LVLVAGSVACPQTTVLITQNNKTAKIFNFITFFFSFYTISKISIFNE